jgi:four helix bundle protein
MRDVRKLEVAAQAKTLAVAVYVVTKGFPTDERFGLAAQMRRAAVSVASNIAEGAGRRGDRELVHFLHVALGSACELAIQIEIATSLDLLSAADGSSLGDRVDHVQRMLYRFSGSVRRKLNRLATAE